MYGGGGWCAGGGAPGLAESLPTKHDNYIWAVRGSAPPGPGKLKNRTIRMAGGVALALSPNRPADVLLVGSASGVKETRR